MLRGNSINNNRHHPKNPSGNTSNNDLINGNNPTNALFNLKHVPPQISISSPPTTCSSASASSSSCSTAFVSHPTPYSSAAPLDSKIESPRLTSVPLPYHSPASHHHSSFLLSYDIVRSHSQQLTSAELYEILDYEEIYYWGQAIYASGKKKVNGLSDALPNHGYDDSKGDYLIQFHDHISFRYEVIQILGKGSFGQVVRAFDHKSNTSVALKIIRNKKRFTSQGEIELKILQELKCWDPEDAANCVQMIDNFKFRNHLCIVFELLSINLYEFIKGNEFRGFSIGLIRRFTVQMLNCLCLLWKHEIIHCDLKPENVLLKSPTKSNIKVIDFGSSCHLSEKAYTYIQSRFYRSPEVILGGPYDMAIDMWSLGCMLAELYTGHPLFPGENEQDQLWCMMELLGFPDDDLLRVSERKNLFFDVRENPIPHSNSKGKIRLINGKSLVQCVRSKDEQFLDFIRNCLAWDPKKRMTPMDAIHHPWIVQIDSATARGISEVRSNPPARRSITAPTTSVHRQLGGHALTANSPPTSIVSSLLNSGKLPRSLPPLTHQHLSPPQPSAIKLHANPRTSYSHAVFSSNKNGHASHQHRSKIGVYHSSANRDGISSSSAAVVGAKSRGGHSGLRF